jgi:MFS family permease
VLRLVAAIFLVQSGYLGYAAAIPLALARGGQSDADIGIVVGTAALIQIGAALVGGVLIDRFGGVRLFVVGGALYAVASALIFVAAADLSALALLLVARVLQGIGFGMSAPAAQSVIPGLVSAERRGFAIAASGVANNLAFVLMPLIGIAVLDAAGLAGVAVFEVAMVLAGVAVALVRPLPHVHASETDLGVAKRRFGFAYRRSWIGPLLVIVLYIVHWGFVTAYLPQRAEAAGASIGLFLAADGVFVLLMRLPAGWLADRIRPIWLVVGGLAATVIGVALLLLPPTNALLMVAGALTGTGGAVVLIPIMVALTDRSTEADRGSAFALFSAAFAGALALGSIGSAPLIGSLGFDVLLVVGIGAIFGAIAVAVADRELRISRPHRADQAMLEIAEEAPTPLGA